MLNPICVLVGQGTSQSRKVNSVVGIVSGEDSFLADKL